MYWLLDQGETWHGGRPRPRPHCVRWGHRPQERDTQFSAHVLWQNGWIDQDATWYGGRSRARRHCEMGTHLSPKREHRPQFAAHSIVAKRLDGSRCHLVRIEAGPGHCVRREPSSPAPRKGAQQLLSPHFSAHVYCGQMVPVSAIAKLLLLFGRPVVKRFALSHRTVVCLSCLLRCLGHRGQMVGWIKIPLGMEVGLGPGHIVLDGDPDPPRRGTKASPSKFTDAG